MLSGKWWSFCLCLNVLKDSISDYKVPSWTGSRHDIGKDRLTKITDDIDGLVQERRNSSALVLELQFLALTHWYHALVGGENWAKVENKYQ